MVKAQTFVCVLLVVLSSLAAIEARRSHRAHRSHRSNALTHALTQSKVVHRTEKEWSSMPVTAEGSESHCQRYKHVVGCIFGHSAATCEENPFNPCPMGHKCTCQPREQDYFYKRVWKAVKEYTVDTNYCNCVQRSCVEWAPGECVIESPQSMVVNNFWSVPPTGHGCAFVEGHCQIVACSPKQIEDKVVGVIANGGFKETFNCATDPAFWTDMTVEKRKKLSQELHGSRFTPVLELIKQQSLETQTETGVSSETSVEPAPEIIPRELDTEAVGKSVSVPLSASSEVDTCAAAEQFFVHIYKRWPVFAKTVASESLLNRFSSLVTPASIPVYSGHPQKAQDSDLATVASLQKKSQTALDDAEPSTGASSLKKSDLRPLDDEDVDPLRPPKGKTGTEVPSSHGVSAHVSTTKSTTTNPTPKDAEEDEEEAAEVVESEEEEDEEPPKTIELATLKPPKAVKGSQQQQQEEEEEDD